MYTQYKHTQCSEKFVQGRLQKQQYVDSEASIRSSISDLSNNIDNIIATMWCGCVWGGDDGEW